MRTEQKLNGAGVASLESIFCQLKSGEVIRLHPIVAQTVPHEVLQKMGLTGMQEAKSSGQTQ